MYTVSVIIPTYNRETTVVRAVDSVLLQSYENVECIVVDDGSTDDTADKISAYKDSRVRYIRHETNRGASAARNTGIEAANGEYIAFLDSDDKWMPKKIEDQLEYLLSKPESWKAVYCDTTKNRRNSVKQFFDLILPANKGDEGGEKIIKYIISMDLAVRAGSTLLMEKDTVVKTGGLDESLRRHEELEFLVRFLENGKLGYVDKKLVELYDSGYPSAELMEQEKQKFLAKVSNYVKEAEDSGQPVRCVHNYELAKAYFREGHLQQGFDYLKESCITSFRDLASLIWATKIGIQSAISNEQCASR